MGEEAGRAGEMRLLQTSRGSAGNVPSCPLSLPLSPKPNCGIQGVGRGFSSGSFLLGAAKPLTSLPLPPPQHLPGAGTVAPAPLGSASLLLGPSCPPPCSGIVPGRAFATMSGRCPSPGCAGQLGKPGPVVARREWPPHLVGAGGRLCSWQGCSRAGWCQVSRKRHPWGICPASGQRCGLWLDEAV